MEYITGLRNTILAGIVRKVAGAQVGAGDAPTHQDEVLHIQSRDAGRTIKVHVYKAKKTSQPAPVLINFHGSGFVVPMHGTDDDFALRVIKETPYTVLDVQYRLAPEHPFPAAPNDAEDVVKYVLDQPEVYDLSHVCVSGFSAGGNMSLGLSGFVFPKETFRHVLAYYPPTDLSADCNAKVAPDQDGAPLSPWMMGVFNDCYLPAGIDRTQPLASPINIEPSRFPDSMLIVTCGYDSLATEGEALVNKIKQVPGTHLIHHRIPKVNHAWDKSCKPGTPEDIAKAKAYDYAMELLQK